MAATYIPTPYKCGTAVEVEDTLSDAVAEEIAKRERLESELSFLIDTMTDTVCAKLQDQGISLKRLEDAFGRAIIANLIKDGYVAKEIEETIARGVVDRIVSRGISPAEISRRYSSIRLAHTQKLKRGDGLGFRTLAALTEAVGLRVKTEVTA